MLFQLPFQAAGVSADLPQSCIATSKVYHSVRKTGAKKDSTVCEKVQIFHMGTRDLYDNDYYRVKKKKEK
jgi:hypothetical protein